MNRLIRINFVHKRSILPTFASLSTPYRSCTNDIKKVDNENADEDMVSFLNAFLK